MNPSILVSSLSALEEIQKEILPKNITNILVIGLGASVLNSRALASFCAYTKNLIFLDSIEESIIDRTIKELSQKNTVIIAISKSGSTDETILILKYLNNSNLKNSKLYLVSENSNSAMIKMGQELSSDYKFIEYEKSYSGRFSIFLNASLLPLHFAGVDIENITKIAGNYSKKEEYAFLANNLLNQYSQNRNILVLSVYDSSLIGFAEWVRQIIAESLGKNNFGLTTLISRGTIDEHSQLQLYLDGPDDKIYYLMPFFASESTELSHKLIKHMDSFNQAIFKKNRPCIFSQSENISKIEYGINAICLWLLAVQEIAHAKNIDPFTQPAVDSCKKTF